MPKRSNKFQRLVKNIYEAMSKLEGGKVMESELLTEPNGTKREIDVLLETESYGHILRIAVESRDRSRKDDIEWIDNLIGKYKNLKVDKIIAVSNSGFSEKAVNKALDNNIDVRTLDQCLSLERMKEFFDLRVGGFKIKLKIKSIKIDLLPFTTKLPELIPKIEDKRGKEIATIDLFIKKYYKLNVFPRILQFLKENHYPFWKYTSDIEKQINISFPFEINELYIRAADGSLYEIKNIVYNIEGYPEIFEGDIKHFKYGEKACASIGSVDYDTFKISLNIVQVVGSNLLQISLNGKDIKYINKI